MSGVLGAFKFPDVIGRRHLGWVALSIGGRLTPLAGLGQDLLHDIGLTGALGDVNC